VKINSEQINKILRFLSLKLDIFEGIYDVEEEGLYIKLSDQISNIKYQISRSARLLFSRVAETRTVSILLELMRWIKIKDTVLYYFLLS